ncbi:hypothetical protein ACU997_006624, partial [Pseudomonas aeruginosa]
MAVLRMRCCCHPVALQQEFIEKISVVQRGVRRGAELGFGDLHCREHLLRGDTALDPRGEQRHGPGGLHRVDLESALSDEELAPLSRSGRIGWAFAHARVRYGTVITGYRRCAHFFTFTP